MSKTWVEMSNGVILDAIPFVAYVREGAEEKRFDFTVPNPVNQHGDPDLFHRLSFECIQAKLSGVDHIIRGECSEGGLSPLLRLQQRRPRAVRRHHSGSVRQVRSPSIKALLEAYTHLTRIDAIKIKALCHASDHADALVPLIKCSYPHTHAHALSTAGPAEDQAWRNDVALHAIATILNDAPIYNAKTNTLKVPPR